MTKQDASYETTSYETSGDNDSPLYITHEDEPTDFYRKYKDSDFLPMKGGRNLQNLFDDSDFKDYYWFNIARKHFSKF